MSQTSNDTLYSQDSSSSSRSFTLITLFLNDLNQYHITECVVFRSTTFETGTIGDLRAELVAVHRQYGIHLSIGSMRFYKPLQSIFSVAVWFKNNMAGQDPEHQTELFTRIENHTKISEHFNKSAIGKENLDLIFLANILPRTALVDQDTVAVKGMTKKSTPYDRYLAILSNVKSKMTPPSTAARSKERQSLQKNQATVVYDGSFVLDEESTEESVMCVVCTVAPPIEIFFPPFGKMIQNLQDPNFKPQAEHIQIAVDIVKRAGVIMTTECTYMSIVQEKLQDLLNARFQNVCKDSGSSPYDGLSGSDAYPFVVLALKRMLGEGSCDPLVEAEYSVLRMWYERKDEREKCCCPTLILAGGGPNLCLAGAVFTDRFIVQRLSDTIFMAQASTSADELIFRVACFISVFENGILELKDFYANLKTKEVKALVPGKPHPRFFPQPTSFLGRDGKVVEFVYERAMDDDAQNVTFLVHTKESQKKLIVKFVERYGYEAHELLAEKDFAPKLHYCGLLDGKTDVQNYPEAQGTIRTDALGLYRGPTRMVVMDFLDGRSAVDSPPPPNARKDIKTALDILHGNGFVFGDLREPNIVYHKASDGKYKAKLIDFDWCGKEGVAFYPPGSAKELFPSGPLTEIKKAHDIVMFTKLFPAEY